MTLPYGAEQALSRLKTDDEPLPVPTAKLGGWPRGSFPLLMFFLTVLSTIWVGWTAWSPDSVIGDVLQERSLHIVRRCILANWLNGFLFSASVLSILLAHEFGHYCMMRRYGVESTFPIFIPFPISPFGTLGALILMDPSRADRKQIFDIGIAGPLAGLVVAVPLAILGLIQREGPSLPQSESIRFSEPPIIQVLDSWLGTEAIQSTAGFAASSVSPFFMAAWIGFFITGLNMVPISQLDGGHVAFGIFGRFSHWIANATFLAAIYYLYWSGLYGLSLMLVLIFYMGINHPPSSDDRQSLGPIRIVLGLLALTLPWVCIASIPIHF